MKENANLQGKRILALLNEWAEKRGYHVAVAPIDNNLRARDELQRLLRSGELGQDFFKNNLSGFTYAQSRSIPRPRTQITVAVPRPAHTVFFNFRGKSMSTIIPPTYVQYRPFFAAVLSDFQANVAGAGIKAELANVPLKTVAASSGLIFYGRNNIGYIDRFGSYFQLIGLVTDMDLGIGGDAEHAFTCPVQERLHPFCVNCDICLKACPTGAIAADRFLLKVENCYTLHSESSNPFPKGMRPPSPGCLVGCLRCQTACPINKKRLQFEYSGISFTQEETEFLVNVPLHRPDSIPDAIERKFSRLGLTESPALFARNLRHMLESKGALSAP